MRRFLLQWSALAAVSVLVASCTPDAPGTVMLAVSSNLVMGQDFTSGDVSVINDANDRFTGGYSFGEFAPGIGVLPFTVAVRRDDESEATHASAVIHLYRGTEIVIRRTVRFELPPADTQKMVHVSLDWLSMLPRPVVRPEGAQFPFLVPESSGCVEDVETLNNHGECVNINALENADGDRRVLDYDPTQIFGGGIAPNDGAVTCWDAKACFAASTVHTLTANGDACTVTLYAPVTEPAFFNLALLTRSTEASETARCGRDGCGDLFEGHGRGVVLDVDVYEVSGSQITLPSAVCKRLSGDAVLVTTSCPQKLRATPLCNQAETTGRVSAPNRITGR